MNELTDNTTATFIDAFSHIRGGNIDSIADTIAKGNGTIKVKTAGLKKDEIIELFQKVAASSNGTHDELKKRAESIHNSKPQSIAKASISYKELLSLLKGKEHPVADWL